MENVEAIWIELVSARTTKTEMGVTVPSAIQIFKCSKRSKLVKNAEQTPERRRDRPYPYPRHP